MDIGVMLSWEVLDTLCIDSAKSYFWLTRVHMKSSIHDYGFWTTP